MSDSLSSQIERIQKAAKTANMTLPAYIKQQVKLSDGEAKKEWQKFASLIEEFQKTQKVNA